jgi:putative Mg2+ transporter-C (MgtC) family protein
VDYREVILRLAAAVAAGGIIGAEREWRQKRAGLRTNVLVAVGAAVFCLIAASAENETSQTRIAAQIASGIGFLGAGVILRDGLNVRGLDTAATLWCAAAAGATAGSGLFAIALSASAIIFAVNVLFPRGVRTYLVLEDKKDVETTRDSRPDGICKLR